ncbi:MAG: beta-galactosidase trimerization domain-containing protein [Chloroflexota bacterium]
MTDLNLPFRQIHLDFHTSELVGDIGRDFNPDQFADTLAQAHVNQVCCFARCHHGMIYYDSALNPERVHPHLVNRNLLPQQIEACHKRGIRVPIYTTIQWDYYTAMRHPEWLVVKADGSFSAPSPYEPGFYQFLCFNSPYRDFLKAHVQEIFAMMPAVDGLFFDIVSTEDCSCRYCRVGMAQVGLDAARESDRLQFAFDTMANFVRELSGLTRELAAEQGTECSIYYNHGRIGPNMHDLLENFTHIEFDNLPSTRPGGYKWLPIQGRFDRKLAVPCVGQTGKFHTVWGDFHSFKNLEALQYECFQALSLNARCLIGDQLPPLGQLQPETYDLIGQVYGEVAAKEPWCKDAEAVVDIAVLIGLDPAWDSPAGLARQKRLRRGKWASAEDPAWVGVTRMLIEGGHQFDLIDTTMDFSPYKVLILPDTTRLSPEIAAKVDAYVANGGKLLLSFESGFDVENRTFMLECMPVTFHSAGLIYRDGQPVRGRYFVKSDYTDYIIPSGDLATGLRETEHVMYTKGMDVTAVDGAEILADAIEPHFQRTWQHFFSHRQAPSSGEVAYPAIVRKDDVIYFGHPIFTLYNTYAPLWAKRLLLNALNLLLPEPLLTHNGPSTLEATVNAQTQENRWVVHLLHYIPLNRAENLEVIEDVIPLYNIEVSVKMSEAVQAVSCVPQQIPLDFVQQDDRVTFVTPKLLGHQMVELSFGY